MSVLVGVIMGSQSDWATMTHAAETLAALEVGHEVRIVSAHRTPDRLRAYASSARARGLRVIIAGAGGAAHLPGMCAAWTSLPVLGVPVESQALKGMDSLLSIAQMPAGIPVGDAGDRAGGGGERRVAGGGDPGGDGRGVGGAAGCVAGGADGGGGRRALMLPPNATIGIIGGGSWGACPRWRRRGWVTVATS